MKKNIGIIATLSVVALLVIFGLYNYYNGQEFILYEEAQTLETAGDFKGAHDKITQAFNINPSNRKVVAYKAKLFFVVENTRLLEDSSKLRAEAVPAMERGDYVTAAEKINKALENVDKVALSSPEYPKAMDLQKKLISDAERLTKEAPEKYYNKAKEHYNSGQYERAYEVVDYIIKPDAKVTKFKDELAFLLGNEAYKKAVNAKTSDLFSIRSGIAWYNKVSAGSPDKTSANEKSAKLKEILETATAK